MRIIGLSGAVLLLAACGGSDNPNPLPTTYNYVSGLNYTVGGTITGLTAGSVVLANGTATVTVAADTSSWSFPVSFTAGSSYSVTVQTQPATEVCEVTSGASGANTGNVGNVTVVCGYGQWNWETGSDAVNAAGVYGTQGTAAAGNTPGARYGGNSWTDASGNFWLFGGVGYGAAIATGYLNDLWQYSPTSGLWTWVNGVSTNNASGVYGTPDTAAAGNDPGARQGAVTWFDASGNLWLFGGYGYDAAGSAGYLNDLWRYSTTTGQWTWISGGNADNANGVYGTVGTAAAGNVPGARQSAVTWTDSSGNFWLFGGMGYAASGGTGNLNDLWRYSPSSGQWTWISGGNGINAAGVYGTEETAAATNIPGARYLASSWIDASGNLWLFGGYGYDGAAVQGKLSDLWQYSPSSGQWTWVSGEDAANFRGVYGTLGIAAATYLPGARQAAGSWVDASGNFVLFGGVGYDDTGNVGSLNDLWTYSTSTKEWTWVRGNYAVNTLGVYGTQGTAAPANAPGGRGAISSWIDSSGRLWLFGGTGYDAGGNLGYLNDLWQYTPGTTS
jgi:N-acetylneuraminic acid mutarotase